MHRFKCDRQSIAGGGHSHLKVVQRHATLKTPLFQTIFLLQRPTIASPCPAPETPLLFFWIKKDAFLAQFSLILAKFQLLRHKFEQKICSQDPSFQPKNHFRKSYFWKPGRHRPIRTKKLFECLPWVKSLFCSKNSRCHHLQICSKFLASVFTW